MAVTLRFGKVDITPQSPLPLFGRVGRLAPAQSVASRLEANCLLIECNDNENTGAAAIVTLDSLYPSQALTDAVAELCESRGLQLVPDALMFVASHTHNAPALDASKPKLGICAPEYLDFVAVQITECLLAMADCETAPITSLHFGQTVCRASRFRRRELLGFNFARLRIEKRTILAPNAATRLEEVLKLLVFRDVEDTPRAVLWSWPCHAVSEPESLSVSADFPGALRNYIRAVLGDCDLPVLYFPGFSGDIRPASLAPLPIHKIGTWISISPRFGKPNQRNAERLHGALEASFDEAWGTTLCVSDRFADMELNRSRRSLPLDEIRSEADGLSTITCDDWCLGPLQLIAVSAEVAACYGLVNESASPLTFLSGCTGQVFGYLPTDRQISQGGYEVEGFASAFSVPGSFKDEIEAKIARLIGL